MGVARTQTDRLGDAVIGVGLLAAGANVIMQLGRPGVGYGVLESKVDSGNLFRHPIKRTRTTITYLAVATMGTDHEKKAYRDEVDKTHAHVRSSDSSPVAYNAFDSELQLWVAACLYKGFEDTYEIFSGDRNTVPGEELYRSSSTLGTTLQVRPDMWPADREEFERYWNSALEKVSIDDTVRGYLYDIATLRFLPRVLSVLLGPFNRFVTTGFLPPTFRAEMGMPWTHRHQRRFDLLMSGIAAVNKRLPRVLRQFPFNLALWDLRKRLKSGRSLV
jgi:uncharacterized protein (DUF2236 family)